MFELRDQCGSSGDLSAARRTRLPAAFVIREVSAVLCSHDNWSIDNISSSARHAQYLGTCVSPPVSARHGGVVSICCEEALYWLELEALLE